MRPLTGITLITCMALACGSSGDHGSATDSHTSTAATEPAETHASHASHASHTGDDGSTAATDESTATDESAATTAGGETTTGVTTGATHGHSSSSGALTEGGTPAEAYCACMLEHCHDQYHGTWGEDHHASEEMCAAAAEALPSVGMPATSGNSIECRLHYCELGHDDPAACDSAIGGGACAA